MSYNLHGDIVSCRNHHCVYVLCVRVCVCVISYNHHFMYDVVQVKEGTRCGHLIWLAVSEDCIATMEYGTLVNTFI